ncbi:hypothetical protein ACIBRY_05990 [Streptomyces anulatus]
MRRLLRQNPSDVGVGPPGRAGGRRFQVTDLDGMIVQFVEWVTPAEG